MFEYLIAAIAGAGVASYSLWAVWGGLRSRAWPTVPGEIARHRVEESMSDDGRRYKPVTAFRYQVDGRPYINERVHFGPVWFDVSSESALASARGELPVGRKVVVHVNPSDPTDSVLEPGVTPGMFVFLAFGLFFLGLGLRFLLFP